MKHPYPHILEAYRLIVMCPHLTEDLAWAIKMEQSRWDDPTARLSDLALQRACYHWLASVRVY